MAEEKRWFDRLQEIDRRWIYLIVFIVVSIPFFLPIPLPIKASNVTQKLYDRVEEIAKQNKLRREKEEREQIVLLNLDWAPATQAENWPQTEAMMYHLMELDVKFVILAMGAPEGVRLGQNIAEKVAKMHNKKYGTDWCNFGYKYMNIAAFRAFIKNIYSIVEKDIRGTPIRDVPMMKNVQGLRDVALVWQCAGGGGPYWWIGYAQPEVGFDIGGGYTAIMGPEQYAWLDSGQMVGMMEGLSGAAQYEQLLGYTKGSSASLAA